MEPKNDQGIGIVNPRLLEVGYRREKANPFAVKQYFPVVGDVVRKPFRTASDAKTEAVRIWEALCAEYDAAVLAMTSSSPVAAEEEQVVEAEG